MMHHAMADCLCLSVYPLLCLVARDGVENLDLAPLTAVDLSTNMQDDN